jgi:HlyD family secretion protein
VLREGRPHRVRVQTGVSDGTSTEITEGDLKEGDAIILDAESSGSERSAPSQPGAPPAGGQQMRGMRRVL